jgi:hypothetical protein
MAAVKPNDEQRPNRKGFYSSSSLLFSSPFSVRFKSRNSAENYTTIRCIAQAQKQDRKFADPSINPGRRRSRNFAITIPSRVPGATESESEIGCGPKQTFLVHKTRVVRAHRERRCQLLRPALLYQNKNIYVQYIPLYQSITDRVVALAAAVRERSCL